MRLDGLTGPFLTIEPNGLGSGLANLRAIPVQRVAVHMDASPLAVELVATLRARGLQVDQQTLQRSVGSASLVVAKVLSTAPTTAEVVTLSEMAATHVAKGRPPLLYLSCDARKGHAEEYAACVALLRAHGAVVCDDPEIFIECVVLLAAYGPPTGPTAAIVAPDGTWLHAAASAHARRSEEFGQRVTPSKIETDSERATDIVLTDAHSYSAERSTRILVVPVTGRPQICDERPALVGLSSALEAAQCTGRAFQRITAGTGPSPLTLRGKEVDSARFNRQLDKLGERVGDHECKVLLSSYGVPITRQAVATTPSAATRIAKKAGFPVEMKAWGDQEPSELEGCLVLRDIQSAADVRRAFANVCGDNESQAAIIRETPQRGRELRVVFRQQGALGLVALLYQHGRTQPAAALCPLRPLDAQLLAKHVVASRASDQAPDASALADLLLRASHMIADNPRIVSLELPRVIVGRKGEGAVVVDARASLQER